MCKTCGCKDAESFGADENHTNKDYKNMQKDLNKFVNTFCKCKHSKGAPSALNIYTSCGYCGKEIDEVSFYGLTKDAESFEAEEWDFGDDREALRKGDEHSDFNNAWRWIFKTKRREWPKWGQKFYDKYKWTLDDPHWNPQLDAESFEAENNTKFELLGSKYIEGVGIVTEGSPYLKNYYGEMDEYNIYDDDAAEIIMSIPMNDARFPLKGGEIELIRAMVYGFEHPRINDSWGELNEDGMFWTTKVMETLANYDSSEAESFGAEPELVGGPCEMCGEDLFRDYDDSMGDVCLSCYYKERSKQEEEGSEYEGWLLKFAESFEAHDHSHIYPSEELTPSHSHSSETFKSPNNNTNIMAAESKFDKLSDKIAKQYRKKGMSAKEAKEIGNKTAYTIGRKKYGKAGMAKKARAGMRAESFEAQGNPDKRTTTQYANFYVGWEDEEGELRGGGKFKKFNDAKAQAEIVAKRNGNSRVVEKRGFALWTDDGKGMWQEGYNKADAKKFYSAEGYSIGSGFRLGFGLGLGMLALSTVTTIVALAASTIDERQVE